MDDVMCTMSFSVLRSFSKESTSAILLRSGQITNGMWKDNYNLVRNYNSLCIVDASSTQGRP